MTYKKAMSIVGNMATWEMQATKKALESLGGFFNTPEDNERLEAVRIVLKHKGNNQEGHSIKVII